MSTAVLSRSVWQGVESISEENCLNTLNPVCHVSIKDCVTVAGNIKTKQAINKILHIMGDFSEPSGLPLTNILPVPTCIHTCRQG